MAEIDLGAGPIFVDVSTGQQYPVNEFSHSLLAHPLDAQPKTILIQLQPHPAPLEELRPTQEVFKRIDPSQVTDIQDENSTAEVEVMADSSEPTTTQDTSDSTAACIEIQKRRIRCPECQRYTAETEEKMLRHIRKVHRGENPFQCLMCDYSTYNKVLFEEHVRIHQGIKPYKCSQCPYRSVSKKNTKKHELIHRPDNPLKCGYCGFIARHPRALECHVKTHVGEIKPEKDVSNKCTNCAFQYTTPEELRNHKKCNKRCKECNYKACTRKILTAHMANAHNKKKIVSKKKDIPKLFNCGLCSWGSSNKAKILLHLIHHPNQKVDESVVDVHILRQFGVME